MSSDGPPLLEVLGVCRSFFGVPVLREVDLAVGPGRILGLVGENGAGKSTLMNILGGVLPADSGRMRLGGEDYEPADPAEASRRGVAFIHQELNLFTNLSIAENLFLPCFPRLGPLIDRRRAASLAREALEAVELRRRPGTLVEDLSPGERQLVEVARALTVEARLIILDEPTTSLTAPEADRLFALIRRLRARGIGMIYISHALEDVLRLCDDVAVLRDGRLVGSGPASGFAVDHLIALMVGRDLGQLFPGRTARPSDEVVLGVEGLSRSGVVEEIRFSLRRGEILGLAGLMGSGRTELARILFGLDPADRGEVRLLGRPLGRSSPRARIRRGLAMLTEDRRGEGLLMEAGVAENVALASLPRFSGWGGGLLDGRRIADAVDGVTRAVRLRAAGPGQPVRTLSGGNQQKVVLARWLMSGPSALILDEPTRGVDVGARQEIYRLIGELAAGGAGVLMISPEIEELIGMCDRILVMSRGEISGEFPRGGFDREAILRAALRRGLPR
ncbi:sugar ABC transporter ATP-binding protein [Tautonia plasticadhaerens]|uniref:Galactose/methyl galactoside import ATP-binding protein MglA n=1 Tax=Tautonia plasticadhaerens TaxID=2527974 RepID=A0A518H1L0_9BACT|nr:sugar ABC transporter ATP-binding protein [Tautonia plasticadhaerens]QDV34720.1 Galactose/methyl galactoside import ATP-binding protein MglA [Tautonia plasticadhaerens]